MGSLFLFLLVFGSCNSKFFRCLSQCPSAAGMVLKYSLLLLLLLGHCLTGNLCGVLE